MVAWAQQAVLIITSRRPPGRGRRTRTGEIPPPIVNVSIVFVMYLRYSIASLKYLFDRRQVFSERYLLKAFKLFEVSGFFHVNAMKKLPAKTYRPQRRLIAAWSSGFPYRVPDFRSPVHSFTPVPLPSSTDRPPAPRIFVRVIHLNNREPLFLRPSTADDATRAGRTEQLKRR